MPSTLIVELVLNGVATGILTPLEAEGRHLRVDAAMLRQAGVALTTTGSIDVASLSGFTARYDTLGQRLLLDVPAALLPEQRIVGTHHTRVTTTADTGALLAYDAYVEHAGGRVAASLWSEQRIFGAFGALSNTGVLRIAGGSRGYTRLDTTYRLVNEDSLLAATAGDLFSNALAWSSSVRMGGVQLARSFRARPDLVTQPLPSFSGQAAVPTGVDLFIDGYRQSRTEIAPGRFVLDDIPVVNGAGDVTVVTTDAVGRQIATTIPFYVTPELLRPGLTDFSIEAGALRRGYALRSFGYQHAVASASVRRGLTRRLTIESHLEASRKLGSFGAGLVWSPANVGAFHGALAVSDRNGANGWQLAAGYAYQSRRFTVGLEHLQRSTGYADLASFDLAALRGSMRSDRASASVVLGHVGSVGLAYIDAEGRDGIRARLASVSWSAPAGRGLSLFANANYDVGRHALSAQLRLLVPLGRASASTGVSTQPGRGALTEASFDRSVPSDGGLGGTANIAVDRHGGVYGQASAGWRSRAVSVEAGVAATPSSRSVFGGASGALIAMDGGVFAAPTIPDAFAVVDTEIAGVPVRYENQPVGTTDAHGRLFVSGATAFHPGRYAIDTLDLPAGAVAERVEQQVALRQGTGAVVRMPVRKPRIAMLSLVDAAGRALAAGGEVLMPDGTKLPIGWDGVVAIDAGNSSTLDLGVTRQDGTHCSAHLSLPQVLLPYAPIAGVLCR